MVAWLLKTPIQKTYGAGVRFMAKRPAGSAPQTRYHCGIDIAASEGALILAPEPCTIIDTDRGWDGSAKATLLHTDSGFSLLLGCTALGASPPVGTHLNTGEIAAVVGYYTKTNGEHSSMLHFQTYGKLMTPAQVNHSQSWAVNTPRPDGLVDPLEYLAMGVSPQQSPPQMTPSDLDVHAEGGWTANAPCPTVNGQVVCLVNQVEAWHKALIGYHAEMSKVDYIAANLGLSNPPKKPWTPAAEQALQIGFENQALIDNYEQGLLTGLPNEIVNKFVAACKRSRWATETFKAFIASPSSGGAKGSQGGSGVLMLGAALAAAGGLAGILALSRRKRRAA